MTKVIYDHVLVKVASGDEYERDTGFKGVDGKAIEIEPEWNPMHHRKNHGIVVSVPSKFSYQNSGIKPKVKVGDLIYFHFNTLAEDKKLFINKENLYMLEYNRIFCRIDNGIDMVGSWILVNDIDSSDLIDVGVGKLKGKVRESGIAVLAEERDVKKKKPGIGILAAIAEPREGGPDLKLKPGDKVYYEPNSMFDNIIEGKEYFVMHQDDLMACVEKKKDQKK
jgi:co-chaperonin GroES (HSP10)